MHDLSFQRDLQNLLVFRNALAASFLFYPLLLSNLYRSTGYKLRRRIVSCEPPGGLLWH